MKDLKKSLLGFKNGRDTKNDVMVGTKGNSTASGGGGRRKKWRWFW